MLCVDILVLGMKDLKVRI